MNKSVETNMRSKSAISRRKSKSPLVQSRIKSGDENKEVKFVSFVQKLEHSSSKISLPKDETEKKLEIESPSPLTNIDMKVIITSTKTLETTNSAMAGNNDCSQDEIILCECCKYTPLTPTPTLLKQPNNSRNEIFHLTETDSQLTAQQQQKPHQSNWNRNETIVSENEPSSMTFETKLDLKEILLTNYDPKFARKIGIKDFLPIQLMSSSNASKAELEFIPFEKIDQKYPK